MPPLIEPNGTVRHVTKNGYFQIRSNGLCRTAVGSTCWINHFRSCYEQSKENSAEATRVRAMTRLLNWNVRNSAPTLIERQLTYLQSVNAETLVLTEVNCNHLAVWSNRLSAAGYKSVLPAEFEETARGVLLASRADIEPLPTLFKHPLCQCSLSAIIQIGSKSVELHGIYARADAGWPIKKRYKKDIHRAVANGIGARIGPQIVAGDFNAPRKEIDGKLVTWAQQLSKKPGVGWYVVGGLNAKFWRQKHEAELAIFQPRHDMVDAFRACHQFGELETSWQHLRLDHIVVSKDVVPDRVQYLIDSNKPPPDFPSDHAPMLAVW
jgi:exonuclease III